MNIRIVNYYLGRWQVSHDDKWMGKILNMSEEAIHRCSV